MVIRLKKIIVWTFSIFFMLILCGCSKEVDYSNYEHYDLKENEGFYSLEEIQKNLSIPQAFLQFLKYFNLNS